ncbi:MAG: succinate dehydrogenase assembly factor 2 [Candidatus Thiodiazotropha sp.]
MSEITPGEDEISRLRWQCRRGMLELDYLFEAFLERQYRGLDPQMQAAFVALLEHPDPVLHAWCIIGEPPGDERLAELIRLIRRPI